MSRVLAAEYITAVGFASWASLKDKQLPWPPTLIRCSIGFGVLGMVSVLNERLADILGAGFLLAQLVTILGSKKPYTGAAPQNNGDKTGRLPNVAQGDHPDIGILSFGNPKVTH